MDIRVEAKPQLCGTVLAPSSKSDAHRALICAALADSPSAVCVTGTSNDIEATVCALCALGARIEALPFLGEEAPLDNYVNGMCNTPHVHIDTAMHQSGAPCSAHKLYAKTIQSKTVSLDGAFAQTNDVSVKPVACADTLLQKNTKDETKRLNLRASEASIKTEHNSTKSFVLYRVTPIGNNAPAECTIDCGESGSTLRFLMPVAAALCQTVTFVGKGRLGERPMSDLCNVLRKNGCEVSADFLPITVRGKLESGTYALRGDVSSQYISGLLFALPLLPRGGTIALTSELESAAYAELTLRVMARYGVVPHKTANGFALNETGNATDKPPMPRGARPAPYETCEPPMPRGARPGPYRAFGRYDAEGDWSNAAFWLCARFLGAYIDVTGLTADSVQGDRAVLQVLSDFSKSGDLYVHCSAIPDLVPILAVTACARNHATHFTGCARLRIKESDRIKAVCDLIASLGGNVCVTDITYPCGTGSAKGVQGSRGIVAVTEIGTDGHTPRARSECGCVNADTISVYGTGALTGGTVDGMNDHRIVMAAAIASLLCTKPVDIRGAEAVRKSYPAFFDDFNALGGNAHVIDIR